ncbi:MAG: hypothetical protein ACTHOB_02570 [Ginsengibacter sp.]
MKKKIHIFKSLEEQEMFFLEYFFHLNPSDRLKALSKIQKKNIDYNEEPVKKITIRKHFVYGDKQ